LQEINNIDGNKELILGYLYKFGFMPEHNFEYFKRQIDEGVPAFVHDGESGFMCFFSNNGKKLIAKGLVEPLAAQEKIIPFLKKFIRFCIEEKKLDKVVLETRYETKLKLAEHLNGTAYRVVKERYHLTWPVFITKNFDETLSGGKWKKIRYFKNKFFKDYAAIVDDAKDEDRDALNKLVMGWKNSRTATDRAYYKGYLEIIKSGFSGFDMVKVIRVQGRPISIFGGWKIVNSNNYYSCLGIYDYAYENIGEVSNVIDLALIKQMGVEKADFGGGEVKLTNFKKKFFPDEFYRTDVYTVDKRS